MSDQPSLIERLKRARIVQVFIVFMGASWVVLQLVGTLKELLELPAWIGPVTVILLGIGLVVVTATAWVQSLDATTKAEEAGEVPTDWQVAPAELVGSILAGKLPHLTWGRAILGGVVAISLAIGVAGAYVLVTGGGGLIGPTAASAAASRSTIAVLPFQTRGEDLEVYGEGMVDLLSANLQGLGGLRTIDAGTVIARWKSRLGDDFTAELQSALDVAGSLDARFAVRGSVVPVGSTVRITADIFDLADGERVDGAQIEGPQDDFLSLVNGLTIDLAQRFLGTSLDRASPTSESTRSVPALEAYLRGNALYRHARFVEAIEALTEAVTIDPEFALAWWRLADAWGWERISAPEYAEASRRSAELAYRLPARERQLVEANDALTRGDRSPIAALRAYVDTHPDDGEAWNQLAEFGVHSPWLSMSSPEDFAGAIRRAVELMPTFPPIYTHLIHYEANQNNKPEFDRLLEGLTVHGADPEVVEATERYWDFYRGVPTEQASAAEYFRNASAGVKGTLGFAVGQSDDLGRRFLDAKALGSLGSVDRLVTGIAELHVGLGPTQWPPAPSDGTRASTRALGELTWMLVAGAPAAVPARISRLLDAQPGPSSALSVAMYAAAVGDDPLRDRALGMLEAMDLESSDVAFGYFNGPPSVASARNNTTALGLLRTGRPSEARSLVAQNLSRPSYDGVSMLIAGDVAAANGEWADAVRYWRSLLLTHFRPNVRIRLGRAHEALGDTDAALEAYEGFLTMWDGADESLAPMIEARAAVARLSG